MAGLTSHSWYSEELGSRSDSNVQVLPPYPGRTALPGHRESSHRAMDTDHTPTALHGAATADPGHPCFFHEELSSCLAIPSPNCLLS